MDRAAVNAENASSPCGTSASRVEVVDDLHDAALVDEIYQIFKGTPMPNNIFWVSADLVKRYQAGDLEGIRLFSRYYPESAAVFIMRHLAKLMATICQSESDPAAGFEIWTRSFAPNHRGMYIHIDCDQIVYQTTATAESPRWGTVFYAGPRSGLVGGETLINTQVPVPASVRRSIGKIRTLEQLRQDSPDWLGVSPRFNRLTIFHGSLAHGVASTGDGSDSRVTFLVNVWSRVLAPYKDLTDVCLLSPEHFKLLTRLPHAQAVQLDGVRNRLSPAEYVELVRAITALPGGLYDHSM